MGNSILQQLLESLPAEGRVLVLCSGGLDSTTLLALCVRKLGAGNVEALSITYGQRHIREVESAKTIAATYGVRLRFLDLTDVFANSECTLLTSSGEAIPQGTYSQQQAEDPTTPVSTYVPFRNGLFLSSAAAVALSSGCQYLAYGAHADDVAMAAYPDCSPEFVEAMGQAIHEGTGGQLSMIAPFVQATKADIVELGLEMGVPYELTWSCYEGGEKPCGTCATCLDRIAAFEANGVTDPLMK